MPPRSKKTTPKVTTAVAISGAHPIRPTRFSCYFDRVKTVKLMLEYVDSASPQAGVASIADDLK